MTFVIRHCAQEAIHDTCSSAATQNMIRKKQLEPPDFILFAGCSAVEMNSDIRNYFLSAGPSVSQSPTSNTTKSSSKPDSAAKLKPETSKSKTRVRQETAITNEAKRSITPPLGTCPRPKTSSAEVPSSTCVKRPRAAILSESDVSDEEAVFDKVTRQKLQAKQVSLDIDYLKHADLCRATRRRQKLATQTATTRT